MQDLKTKQAEKSTEAALDSVVTDMDTLRRRPLHVACMHWLAKCYLPLHLTFATIGFLLLMLPILCRPWRAIVESIPPLAWFFDEFSLFRGYAMGLLYAYAVFVFILSVMAKHYPGGWDWAKESRHPYLKEMIEKQLYPRTKKEEFVYWVDLVFGILETTVWLYLPFGLFAFFAR